MKREWTHGQWSLLCAERRRPRSWMNKREIHKFGDVHKRSIATARVVGFALPPSSSCNKLETFAQVCIVTSSSSVLTWDLNFVRADMSYKTLDSHVHFLLQQPLADRSLAANVLSTPALCQHESSSFDNPPPWEPQFEEISSSLSSPLLRSRRPLDPPPLCFSTPSPLRIRSHDFPPFRIPAVSDKVTDGFRVLYPHNIFERHGINRADWIRFLEDLGIAARLSVEGLSAVGSRVPLAPSLIHRIFPSRALGAVYDGCFARNPANEVRALIRIWNECAFERRKLRVTLYVRPIGTSRKKSYELVVESL